MSLANNFSRQTLFFLAFVTCLLNPTWLLIYIYIYMYWIYVICKLSTKRNANGILKDFKEFIKQTNKQAISLTINKNHTIRPHWFTFCLDLWTNKYGNSPFSYIFFQSSILNSSTHIKLLGLLLQYMYKLL